MSTRLEHFPNELILCLFVYFDVPNLYHSFWRINQRFNALLRSLTNLSLLIAKVEPCLIDIFAPQIVRLKVDTRAAVDFTHFINLQSLELCQATADHLEQVRSDLMPNLVQLTIHNRFHISLPSETVHQIFSDGFRSLRHVTVKLLDTFPISSETRSLSIHTLCITCSHANVVVQCLSACPNLASLNVTLLGADYRIPPLPSPSYAHPLERFSLDDSYDKLTSEAVQTLLLYIPHVKYLSLKFLCRTPFVHLVESICKRLERLDQLECQILEWPNDQMVDVEVIQQMNDCLRYLQCDEQNDGSRLFLLE